MSNGTRLILTGGGTGGHLYPALAIGAAVTRRDPAAEVLYVGAERGIETQVLPRQRVSHHLLPMEPVRRSRVWENWKVPVALVRSIAQLRRVFNEFDPQVVVGTGGYASVPAIGWSLLRRIPTALQEQNSYPGMATRLYARRVDELYLAFPEAERLLSPGRRTSVVFTGNPIAPPSEDASSAEARQRFGISSERVILVTGGSQGARAINDALTRDLRAVAAGDAPPIPENVQLLWSTGPTHHAGVSDAIREMGLEARVRVVPYIDDMPSALALADLAISRAGAMALSELCAWGIPSVLIPYPYATADHQRHNAASIAEAGGAVLITESDLEPNRLWESARSLITDDDRRGEMARRATERGRPHAADQIAERLITLARRNG